MKTLAVCLFVWFPLAGAAFAEEIARLGLDDLSGVAPLIRSDSASKTEGEASIRISAAGPVVVRLGQVKAPKPLGGAKLVFRADAKSDLKGRAFLEMWVEIDGGRYFSRGLHDPVRDVSGWKSVETPFVLQKGQDPASITLNVVIDGEGEVWIDNVSLSREPLE